MAAVSVSRTEDRLIAVKEVPAERAAETEREADLLRQINHPGVVRFVDLVKTPDGGRALHTLFVSSDTWATRPLINPIDRATGVAALAAVLADLHDLGLAHRYLTAGHVLHGDDDRPVLCSLTRADEATPENRRIDLDALADLTYDDAVVRGPLTGKLSSLANETRTGQLSARGLAGKLDRLLAQRAPRIDTARSGDLIESLRRKPKKTAAVAGLGLIGIAAVIVALTSGLIRGSEQPTTDSMESSASGTMSITGPEDLAETVLVAAVGASLDNSAVAADMNPVGGTSDLREVSPKHRRSPDGNGYPQPAAMDNSTETPDTATSSSSDDVSSVRLSSSDIADVLPSPGDVILGNTTASRASDVTISAAGVAMADSSAGNGIDGTVIEHRGRRYAIGVRDDIVRTGDWDCNGVATPSIVRPSTGEVVLFESWPNTGETIVAPVRWLIEAPLDVQVENYGYCDVLRVHTATGSHLLDMNALP